MPKDYQLGGRSCQGLTWTDVQFFTGLVNARMPVADRREQLVLAALRVASTHGIAATTVRRVAQEAGVALGVVHYCFTDKNELFAALATRMSDRLAAAGSGALVAGGADSDRDDGATPDLATALRTGVAALWQAVEATPGEQLLTYEITSQALRRSELREVATRQYRAAQSAAEDLLTLAAEAAGATWTRPVGDLAAEALAFLDGVVLRWLVDADSAAARARLDRFADTLPASAAPPRPAQAAADDARA
jgi:AcrR family transcriptional regulator